jgi:hypothetical protein
MSCEYDLRILAEIADEINEYKYCGLPGSLRNGLTTKRAKDIALLLEGQAYRLITEPAVLQLKIDRLERENNALRDENQMLTDFSLRHES